mmetsp:Transcript_39310/g.101712  ORF Transcript_39310/g.101712 Transcript_39310/m.101712 type:complete len:202 (+) Transcript_39310:258-863(+)
MDEVLRAVEAVLGELALDHGVVRERDALLSHLAVATLVDELADRFQAGVAVGHVRLDELKHLQDGLVDLQEHAVVELLQAQELQHLAGLRAQFDDADDPDHEQQLGLGLHEEVAAELGLAAQVYEFLLIVRILLLVLLGPVLERDPLLLVVLLRHGHGHGLLLGQGLVPGELQLDLLRNRGTLRHDRRPDRIPGRHGCEKP